MASGEFDLIARLRERLPAPGPRLRLASGDDAAVVEPTGAASATTIDAIVEGVHFRLPEFPAVAVGRKALGAALSDLAAMGAEPGEAYVFLGVPESIDDATMIEVADGLAEVAERERVTVAGGDVSGSRAMTLCVACVGYERPGIRLVTRGGARPGDVVALTGDLGAAAAGLALLEGDEGAGGGIEPGVRERLIARQLDPRPRIAAGRALAANGATAMIDLSDGLGADAGHLAGSSGARLEIDLERVPVAKGVEAVAGGGEAALELALSGGEDFELLACLPGDRLEAAAEAVEEAGQTLTAIGEVTEGGGAVDQAGRRIDGLGFDHIRGSRSGPG